MNQGGGVRDNKSEEGALRVDRCCECRALGAPTWSSCRFLQQTPLVGQTVNRPLSLRMRALLRCPFSSVPLIGKKSPAALAAEIARIAHLLQQGARAILGIIEAVVKRFHYVEHNIEAD